MDIHDNGTGFDVHGMRGQCCGQHLGMFAMRERIEMVGGTFCVESSPGNPTTLKITLPEAPDGTGNIRVNRSAETSLECV